MSRLPGAINMQLTQTQLNGSDSEHVNKDRRLHHNASKPGICLALMAKFKLRITVLFCRLVPHFNAFVLTSALSCEGFGEFEA